MIQMEMDLGLLTNEQIQELLKHVAKEAIQIQSAVNLSGVVCTWAQAMDVICELDKRENHGTEWKNSHPINRLFATQVAHLTGIVTTVDDAIYHEAYAACEALAA